MKTEVKEFKASFVDGKGYLTKVEIELRQEEKGLTFSMCGEYNGSLGQCFGEVKPRTPAQKDLIEMWKTYHLNDMHAGTEEQEEALKDFKDNDYEKRCEYLKQKGLYSVKLKDGSEYKYGHAWLYRGLPTDIEQQVKDIIAQINAEEEEFRQRKIEESDIKGWEDIPDDKVIALAKSLGITPQEAGDIEDDGDNSYTYEGISYFIGTEDETEEQAKRYLTDDDSLWIEAVKAGNTRKGAEEWAEEVINIDGYGSILNHYDGSEDTEEVNGEVYYIIRI